MIKELPDWIETLESEDLEFIKQFVLNSGSLKQIVKIYDVSYPTVRIRLERLIGKIKVTETTEQKAFIKQLSIDDRIRIEDAKQL
ncbi:DUF2089 domain-containing protein [Virgibacillus proomii]|nr:DUF2089 family protein [Virgibacillus proomii]MBU5265743.1 DUF2089 domain-containing protein [Virgibacillus proomii]